MALDLFIPPLAPEAGDESLASFVRRRLGNEALERLAEPLLGAIYSARIEELSAAAVIPNLKALEQKSGSLIRGLLQQRAQRQTTKVKAPPPARFLSLRYGLESLSDALLSRLAPGTLRLNCPVEAIAPGLHRRWRVSLTQGEVIETDAVVLAVPAPVAARLLAPVSEQAARYLARISYSDAVVVNAMFERAAIRHDLRASGFVLPLKQRRYLRACTFASVKFCQRAPDRRCHSAPLWRRTRLLERERVDGQVAGRCEQLSWSERPACFCQSDSAHQCATSIYGWTSRAHQSARKGAAWHRRTGPGR